MTRKVAPPELNDLYDQRVELRIRVLLLEERDSQAPELAISISQLAAVNDKIRDIEAARLSTNGAAEKVGLRPR